MVFQNLLNGISHTMKSKNISICVIGIGYVGLPISVAFGKKFSTLGYDINLKKIKNLSKGYDETGQYSSKEIRTLTKLQFTNNTSEIKGKDFYIIAVPTPINSKKTPDLRIIKNACKLVARAIKKNLSSYLSLQSILD